MYFNKSLLVMLEANRDGGEGNGSNNNANNDSNNNQSNNNSMTLDTWLASQDEAVRNTIQPLITAHIERLQNTVRDTRQERDDFSRQLREATAKLKENSEERAQFEQLSQKLDLASKRADFYEDAPSNGCINAKAAFAIAQASNLFTRTGAPDWKAIKEEAPELFGAKAKRVVSRTAGEGTENNNAQGASMNDWIRASAGRSVTT